MSRDMDELVCRLVRESDGAWLVRDEDGTEDWLPKSKVDFPGGCRVGAVVTLEVPRWLLEEKGLG